MCLARVTKIHRPFLPLSKYEKQKGIGQDMSIGNLILVVNSVSVSCLIHYDTLLQNATDGIAKCDRWYCKMRQMVLQNVTDGIAKCGRWYCKMWQMVLQNATDGIAKCDCYFITKCDICYKLRQYTRSLIFGPR